MYSVEGPELYGESKETARWGVSAILERSFAERLAKEKRTTRIEQILEEGVKEIAHEKRRLLGSFEIDGQKKPFLFYEDTCLVRTVQVPGDSCDIGLDESSVRYLEKFRAEGRFVSDLEYAPHNVDSFLQAVFLEILFRQWANNFEYLIE